VTRPARRLAAGGVALMALVALAGAWGPANAESAPSGAARLMARMRAATGTTDFSGVVTVTWRGTDGRRERATVDVRSVGGALQVSSGGNVIVDEGDHTFFRDELGWTEAVGEAEAHRRPRPDAIWDLSLRPGTLSGRPVTTVVASRADGTVAQRTTVDDATSLPLARAVLDADGRVQRSFRFVEIDLAPPPAVVSTPRSSVRAAEPISDVPDGYRGPEHAGAGFVLVSRTRHDDGVHLVYSDGLFSVSVLEQRGEVDWGAMPRGTETTVDGEHARRYVEPMGDVVVWERDGVVYTCVSDAPPDSLDGMLAGLSPNRSVPERLVDFVLGPFGFE
jgi:hypothetical protein